VLLCLVSSAQKAGRQREASIFELCPILIRRTNPSAMYKSTADTKVSPKDTDKTSKPAKKRRFEPNQGTLMPERSSQEEMQPVAPSSVSASRFRSQSKQEQQGRVSGSLDGPSFIINCPPSTSEPHNTKQSNAMPSNNKQDSLQTWQHPKRPRSSLKASQDNHEVNFPRREAPWSPSRRKVDQQPGQGRYHFDSQEYTNPQNSGTCEPSRRIERPSDSVQATSISEKSSSSAQGDQYHGEITELSHRREQQDYNRYHSRDNRFQETSSHPRSFEANNPPTQENDDVSGDRSASLNFFRGQVTFSGSQQDHARDESLLQNRASNHRFASLSRPIPIREGEYNHDGYQGGRRYAPESYAASLLSHIYPFRDEVAPQLEAFAAPRLSAPSRGIGTSIPLYSAASSQAEAERPSNSMSFAYREALHKYCQHLETERNTLPTNSGTSPLYLNSNNYDGLHQGNNSSHREDQSDSTLASEADGQRLQSRDAQYIAELVRREADRRLLNAERPQTHGPSIAFLSGKDSLPPLGQSRMQPVNDYNLASLTSSSVLAQQRSLLERQMFAGSDESDPALLRPGLLPPASMSQSLLLSPRSTAAELLMSHGSRRARDNNGLTTSQFSPHFATAASVSTSSQPLTTNAFPTDGLLTAHATNNASQQQYRDQHEARRRSFSSVFGTGPEPPPCVEGALPICTQRTVLSLAIEDDKEWCSDLISFVRSELVEVFRASGEDVAARIHNKRIVYHQVGIRCKFCAHLPRNERARRNATFPSSIDGIQQGVSMMMREHFFNCSGMPDRIMAVYKRKANQKMTAESASRKYWQQSARRLGLVETLEGIMFYTDVQARQQPPLPSAPQLPLSPLPVAARPAMDMLEAKHELLIEDVDRSLVPDYLYFLMSQAQRISLIELDREGTSQQKRSSLPIGMDGFGCRHCCNTTRGENRFFPPKRRLFASRAKLLYKHIQQCPLCPREIKVCINLLKSAADRKAKSIVDEENEKAFYARIWARLHGHIPTGVSVEGRERSTSTDVED